MAELNDLTDFFDAGNTVEELFSLVQETAEREPGSSGAGGAASRSRPSPGELSVNENGVPYKTLRNGRIAIDQLGITVSYDTFANRYLIEGLPGFGPLLDDAALTRIRLLIEEEWGLIFGKDRWFDIATDEARRNSFHPVLDYLAGLHWDGVARLETWLHRYGGAEEGEYVSTVSKIALIAAVRRVRKPGCKFDEMIVLESEQGTNKSSALTVLAVNEEWFTDDVPLNADQPR